MGNVYHGTLASNVFTPDSTTVNYTFADTLSPATLSLQEDGNLELGDGFIISVKELRACLKVMRELARKEYPEDFI